MTRDDAILFVQGMLKSVRPYYRDDGANEWARSISWFEVAEEVSNGEARDYKERDWTVDEAKLPELIAAARTDGGAFETAQRLACAYLRWIRPMPEPLARHVIGILTGTARKPHRKTATNQVRDEMAVVAINYLQRNANIAPDRNAATPANLSGIDIVTEALRQAGYTATYSAIRTAFYKGR